jgi:hypothetical protein
MDVRMCFGRHQGQIVDLETETALVMLKDGRAENPYLDPVLKLNPANTEPRLRADAVPGINIEPAPGRKKKGSAK